MLTQSRENLADPNAQQKFRKLSSDESPTHCPANSTMVELDTGKLYYWNVDESEDGGEWVEFGTAPSDE